MARIVTRIALVVAYLISLVVGVIALDANGGGSLASIWLLLSLLLGAGTGDFRLAALALLAIPLAIPFGLPADRTGDPVFPVWVVALYYAPFSAVLILLAAGVRRTVEAHWRRRRVARKSEFG